MSEIMEVEKPLEHRMPVAKGFEVNPGNFDEAMKWCSYISRSNIVPKNFQTPEGSKIDKGPSVYAAIIRGQELGMKPMQALASINVINGTATLSTDAKKALCMRYGKISQTFAEDGGMPRWTVKVERPGCADVQITYTAADAAQAGLMCIIEIDGKKYWAGKENTAWKGYWKRMLLKRAMSWALDEAFPDILNGLATTEDLADGMTTPDAGTIEATAEPVKAEVVQEVSVSAVPQEDEQAFDTANRILAKGD